MTYYGRLPMYLRPIYSQCFFYSSTPTTFIHTKAPHFCGQWPYTKLLYLQNLELQYLSSQQLFSSLLLQQLYSGHNISSVYNPLVSSIQLKLQQSFPYFLLKLTSILTTTITFLPHPQLSPTTCIKAYITHSENTPS